MKNSKSCCANCGASEKSFVNNGCNKCGYIGARLPRIHLVGYEKELLFIEVVKYESNNTKAVFIQSLEVCENEDDLFEPYLEITTNIEGAENILNENEIMVKTWSENESFVKPLLESGFFEDTSKRIKVSNFCDASIWKIL